MSSKYSLVVFDWDGTVMDSTPSIVEAIQASCIDLNLPVPSDELASWVIGLSLEQAMLKAVPTLAQEQVPAFLERYRFHYLTKDPQVRPFPGMVDLLQLLKKAGIPMAVATGKSRVGLDRALKQTGLGHFFAMTRCASESFSKPHPGMLNEIMDELRFEPQHLVMIGDTSHDVLMAKNAGVDCVAVSYGAHTKEELQTVEPVIVVHTVVELARWLLPRLTKNI